MFASTYQSIVCTLHFMRFVYRNWSKGTIKQEGKRDENLGKIKANNRNHPPTRSARNEMGQQDFWQKLNKTQTHLIDCLELPWSTGTRGNPKP
jgi:hypothetical protein